ncbi:hypothetical protein GCM10023172_35940 [Hymenobacter ginsengisoli]|uniref:Uncharacterized protein n=1 Tax=Hymenobacter ginsengisoli TaxID=1051626 RepID=A0ABP8QPK4_9BACT
MTEKHFYTFTAQNLGINYTANFSDDFNLGLAKELQTHDHPYGLAIVKDSLAYAVGSDFQYFSGILLEIAKSISITVSAIDVIDKIVYDYHRCTAASVLRIIAKYKDLFSQDLDFGDKDFIKFTKAKHEHQFLWFLNKTLIDGLAGLFRTYGFVTQAEKMESNYSSLSKEVLKIPMPKAVPIYLSGEEESGIVSFDQ